MEKNRKLKGFTLIELIIVVAIFSIILALVLSFIQPVSQIMTRTSVKERTAAYVDNIAEYIDNSVHYARYLNVYEGDFCDTSYNVKDSTYEETAVKDFIYRCFNGAVDGNGNSMTGKVRVLKMINRAIPGCPKVGQMYETVYSFEAGDQQVADPDGTVRRVGPLTNKLINITDISTREILNEEHLQNFSYYYTLGYNVMKPVSDYTAYVIPDSVDPADEYKYTTMRNGKEPFARTANYYFNEVDQLKDNSGNNIVIDPNKFYFAISVAAYQTDSSSSNMIDMKRVADDQIVPLFKSPTHMETISMALINAKNAQIPLHVNPALNPEIDYFAFLYRKVYDASTHDQKKDAENKLMYEMINPGDPFMLMRPNYAPTDIRTGNIYIVYISPEEILDTQITYN